MKEWLNRHVLPTLQDTGTYTMATHPNTQGLLKIPEFHAECDNPSHSNPL